MINAGDFDCSRLAGREQIVSHNPFWLRETNTSYPVANPKQTFGAFAGRAAAGSKGLSNPPAARWGQMVYRRGSACQTRDGP